MLGAAAPAEGGTLPPETTASEYGAEAVAAEDNPGGAPPDGARALATAEMQEKSASFSDASQDPRLPFMQVGIAAAAVLILTWAAFYARGEGVL